MWQNRKLILIITVVIQVLTSTSTARDLTGFVNPFIDTHKSRWFFFASAARPFGMVSLSPDTWVKGDWKAGYLYDTLSIRCFSHVHEWQLSGIPVMPTVGTFKGHLGMEAYKSSFSHSNEVARPGYHSVYLNDYNIRAELTSTCRVGFHKYTFPRDTTKYVIFDVGAHLGQGPMDSAMVQQINDYEIAGYSLMASNIRRSKPTYVYFIARFNQPISTFGTWKKGQLPDLQPKSIHGEGVGAYVSFDKNQRNILLMKVAISYTGIEQARLNMNSELAHWDFEQVVAASNKEWNDYLNRIKIKGGTEKQQIKFYTDLWHALLGRKICSDVDGKYCDMTGKSPVIRQIEPGVNGKPKHNHYNFDAWWGSHWNLNVLWSMVYPEIMDEFGASMVEMYKHGGLIPRGPSGGNYTYVMIGDPASSFFAAAYNKGIRNYDVQKAYEGLYKNAFAGGIRDRAENYKKLWNPQTQFMHPRNINGSWMENFKPISDSFNSPGFCESNSAIYTNFVPHDLAGLIKLFGSKEKYTQYLDSCFLKAEPNRFVAPHNNHAISWVDYENQPSCQMAHLFNHSGAPWLTQKWVREVKETTFGDIRAYGGYNGDEDQGQMGALGVLMAIGLFQMDGGASVNSQYEITSPLFDEIVMKLHPNYYRGKTFVIKTTRNLPENKYIQSAELNGQNWTKFYFPHEIFAKGGVLKLTLGKQPNKNWGLNF